MSRSRSIQLVTVLGAAAVAAACTADISGKHGAGGPGMGTTGGTSGAAGGSGTTPEGQLPSPVCQAGSVVPSFHRLNRIEYQNSVNALLGTDLPLADDLPV